jgi:hypothetical protein
MNALDPVLHLVGAAVHHGKNSVDHHHQPHLPAVSLLDPNDAMRELLFQKTI